MRALGRATAESLFATLFPADCRLCGNFLLSISRLPVCPACLDRVPAFTKPTCTVCGELLPERARVTESECTSCREVKPAFARALAHGPYEGVLRDLIHLLKYDRVRSAAVPLAKLVAAQMQKANVSRDALIVPVPLYRSKYRDRSFNQAEEMARVVKRLTGCAFNPYVLERKRDTGSQTGLSPLQRRENVRGAFAVRRRAFGDIKARHIILIDDVLTTGATTNECARILRRAGAAAVTVVTAARVTRLHAGMDIESFVAAAAEAVGA